MTHIMADMAETMNEVLALVSSLLKEIECLNVRGRRSGCNQHPRGRADHHAG